MAVRYAVKACDVDRYWVGLNGCDDITGPFIDRYGELGQDHAGKEYYVIHYHVGKVLQNREQNMYHDSYFYAVYWDEETGTPKSTEYASTAYGGGGSCTVDATDEIKEKYQAYLKNIADCNRKLKRKARADVLRTARASARSVLHGKAFVRFGSLRHKVFTEDHWVVIAGWLTNSRIRSPFKKSLLAQIVDWCNGKNDYPCPLSPRQLNAFTRMLYEENKPNRRWG